MASTQKRWLTQPKSKVATADLPAVLRNEEAWSQLPKEARQRLYDMLPTPREGEPAHDIDVHPLQTPYERHIIEAMREFQEDLKDGREAKAWRDEAKQANKDRDEGKWKGFEEWQRKEDWGTDSDEDEDENQDVTGDDDDAATTKKNASQSEGEEEDETEAKPAKRQPAKKKATKAKSDEESELSELESESEAKA